MLQGPLGDGWASCSCFWRAMRLAWFQQMSRLKREPPKICLAVDLLDLLDLLNLLDSLG